MHLTIIGGGRAAWAFGTSWLRAGWIVDHVVLREGSTSDLPELLSADRASLDDSISAQVVLVAVPDDVLPEVCGVVVSKTVPDSWLFHASGSHDSRLFGDRARAFTLHPLRALLPCGEGTGLADTLLVFEGSETAAEFAAEITTRFGARLAAVSREQKPIYHAAAVIAANMVAAQLDVASSLMSDAGIAVSDIRGELADLASSAILNWSSRDGNERFTGPIARGDLELVRRHLRHLDSYKEASVIYRTCGLALCRRLLESKPADQALREIEALLSAPRIS